MNEPKTSTSFMSSPRATIRSKQNSFPSWAIRKLAEGRLNELDFPPEYASQATEVARLIQERKVPLISEMFEEARKVGQFKLVACSAGLEYMGVDANAVAQGVDEVLGLPAILAACAGAETTLFI